MTTSTYNRRRFLLEDMSQLETRGISCLGCSGVCCTDMANSMMVTPIEMVDLYSYLKKDSSSLNDLKEKMQLTNLKYKLDILPPGIKKKSQFRRTYTCPFFLGSEFGCPLPRDVKPYGCLGFNRRKKEADIDQDCWSKKEILETQVKANNEALLNEWIKQDLALDWDKEYIPLAVIKFIELFGQEGPSFENFLQRARLTAPYPLD
ncbi:MAG: hypothetical protein ACOVP4_01665 [Bacteriovoracaceae bacterium]|jgi:hypothetical protein